MTVLRTARDFLRLPGVLDVKAATPAPGCVTLVVEPAAAGVKGYLDPGDGDGTGLVPIGTTVHVEVAETLVVLP